MFSAVKRMSGGLAMYFATMPTLVFFVRKPPSYPHHSSSDSKSVSSYDSFLRIPTEQRQREICMSRRTSIAFDPFDFSPTTVGLAE